MSVANLPGSRITDREIVFVEPDKTALYTKSIEFSLPLVVKVKHFLMTGDLLSSEGVSIQCSGSYIHTGALKTKKNVKIEGGDVVIGYGPHAIKAAHSIGYSLFRNPQTLRIEAEPRPCLEEGPRFIQALDLAAISAPSPEREKTKEYLKLAY